MIGRKQLRRLQRRVSAMIDAADGSPLAFSGEREIVLLVEDKPPVVVAWDVFQINCLLGADIVFDTATVRTIERLLATDVVPGLFVIDGFACVDAVAVRPMSQGGVA